MKFETFNEDYVRRLTEGDSEAGAHFAAYFGNLLFLKLRVRLGSSHLIEDIRQETLARVLAILRRDGVKCPERFGPFVNGVCENVMREIERSDQRAEPWDEYSMDEPIDPSMGPDARLINADLRRKIDLILAQLLEKDRRLLHALYLDEMDKGEVCRMLGVDKRYLRVLLHRAKLQFRQAYDRGRGGNGAPPVNPNGA